jgi:hypothetical protein
MDSADAALPTKEELSSLARLVDEWDLNEQDIAMFTEHLKERNAHKLKLEVDLIPSLMASAGGIARFDLEDGRRIELKDELYASITQANQQAAFGWLEAHGHGDVIKDELKIALGRGDVARRRADTLMETAELLGVTDYSRKRTVHPGTLAALIREQLGEGVEVPKETFGVHQQRRAVIKIAKK